MHGRQCEGRQGAVLNVGIATGGGRLQGKPPAVPVIPSFRREPGSCNWCEFLSDALPVFGSVVVDGEHGAGEAAGGGVRELMAAVILCANPGRRCRRG